MLQWIESQWRVVHPQGYLLEIDRYYHIADVHALYRLTISELTEDLETRILHISEHPILEAAQQKAEKVLKAMEG